MGKTKGKISKACQIVALLTKLIFALFGYDFFILINVAMCTVGCLEKVFGYDRNNLIELIDKSIECFLIALVVLVVIDKIIFKKFKVSLKVIKLSAAYIACIILALVTVVMHIKGYSGIFDNYAVLRFAEVNCAVTIVFLNASMYKVI